MRTKEGVLDLKNWECGVPGRAGTIWEGGMFKLNIAFPDGEVDLHDWAVLRVLTMFALS